MIKWILLISLFLPAIVSSQDFIPQAKIAWDFEEVDVSPFKYRNFFLVWGASPRGDVEMPSASNMAEASKAPQYPQAFVIDSAAG